MATEYNYIDIIGGTPPKEMVGITKKMWTYTHIQDVKTLQKILKEMNFQDYEELIDLGCSIGRWYQDYKKLGFKKIIGIDISKERANEAKKRGYDEVHVCNGANLPFEDESKRIVISNGVIVHVLQDSDKLKIFNEVKRVLKKNGTFIFNFPPASGWGFTTDTTRKFSRMNTPKTIFNLVKESKLVIKKTKPSYYAYPRIGHRTKFIPISTKIIFPFFDYFFKKINYQSKLKVMYLGVRKE